MKLHEIALHEIALREADAVGNDNVTVRYVTLPELDALASKHKFVGSSQYDAFGYGDPAVHALSKAQFMATMLSDIPAHVTAEQMIKIAQRMELRSPEDMVYALMDYTPNDVNVAFNQSNPHVSDPAKRPILITTFAFWAKQMEDYSDAYDDENDDFVDDDQ